PLRALECWRDPPSTLVVAEWVSRMGEDLFYPPNVGGWNGGRAWPSTRTIVALSHWLGSLGGGKLSSPARPPDAAGPHRACRAAQAGGQGGRRRGLTEVAWAGRFLSSLLCERVRETVVAAFGESPGRSTPAARQTDGNADVASMLLALLTSPQAHLH